LYPFQAAGYMVSGIDVNILELTVSLRIMRLDSQGNITWQKTITGPGEDLYIGYPVPQIDGKPRLRRAGASGCRRFR
jgi:hypothetical protein